MTLAVAWALNRPSNGDDFLVVQHLLIRVSAKKDEPPLCAILGYDSPLTAHTQAVHLTEVAERLGSVLTHSPRMLELRSKEYVGLCARATGTHIIDDRWKHDLETQQIVLRVLTQGTKV